MYNPDLKRNFLETLATPQAKLKMAETFEIISKYEEKYNKDLCQMEESELKDTLEWCTGIYTTSRKGRILQFKQYINWCIENNVNGACNAITAVNVEGVDAMAMRTVSSPIQLNNYINTVIPTKDVATILDVYRTFLWLGFSGVDLNDVFYIKSSEVDFENMEIVHDGVHYPVYNESAASLYRCARLNAFYRETGKQKLSIERPRAKGDLLLRGFSQPDHGNIRREITRKASKLFQEGIIDRRVNYDDAWKSGIFYRAFMNEIAGVKPTFYDVAKRLADKLHGASDSKNKRIYITAKKRELKQNYDIWKHTFM